jgi:desulfoferrodoxin-like iron-binding protein
VVGGGAATPKAVDAEITLVPRGKAFTQNKQTNKEVVMTEKHQVYKCESCGNIVEVLHAGEGELVCCGQPMKLTVKDTVDVAK